MLDRLLHRSVAVTLDGASYRLRNHHAAADKIAPRHHRHKPPLTRPHDLRKPVNETEEIR
jgi:hypothetical protein